MLNKLKPIFLLDPTIHFLNHGSFGACPRPVFEVYQAWQLKLEQQPVAFLSRDLPEYALQARQALGQYLNTSADNLAFVPNATHGVNIVARSLSLSPGDEILATDHEYGACDYTWEFITQKTGAVYIRQPIPLPIQTNAQILDCLREGITERTRVIYLSHITSPTALCLPVKEICDLARQAGILSIIDGAHAPGQIPLDLDELGADFYTGNCHKWMLAPKGAGFLYTHPKVQNLIEPLIVSWGYHATAQTSTGSQYIDYLQWTGTHDPAAALAVPTAIQFMHDHNWEQVRKDCHQLLTTAIQRICELVDKEPLYPLDSHLFHQMGIAPIPQNTDIIPFKQRLYSEHQIEIPLIDWNSFKFIRISIQAYNDQSDIDALIQALETILCNKS